MIALTAAACGAIASLIFILVGAHAAFTIIAALVGPAVLSWFAFKYWQTISSLTWLIYTLKKTDLGHIKVKTSSPVKPLVDAIAQSAASAAQKTETLEKRSGDLGLRPACSLRE